MTQKEKVIQVIQRTGFIENYKAFKAGITDLQGRIRDLKEDGVQVYSDYVTTKKGTKYKIYTLKKKTLDQTKKVLEVAR